MFFPLNSRLSPSARGQLYLAAIPLAVMVIGRALVEVEELIAARVSELAQLDAALAATRQRLTAAIRLDMPEDVGGAAGPIEADGYWNPPNPDSPPCHFCELISEARTPSGVPVCNLHDPAVKLAPES